MDKYEETFDYRRLSDFSDFSLASLYRHVQLRPEPVFCFLGLQRFNQQLWRSQPYPYFHDEKPLVLRFDFRRYLFYLAFIQEQHPIFA